MNERQSAPVAENIDRIKSLYDVTEVDLIGEPLRANGRTISGFNADGSQIIMTVETLEHGPMHERYPYQLLSWLGDGSMRHGLVSVFDKMTKRPLDDLYNQDNYEQAGDEL